MKINQTKTYKKLKDKKKNNYPEMIILHHSGGTDANPMADTSHHTAEIMETYHLSKGWDGLGYQYVIHRDGSIWAGRPEHVNGAHTVNYNNKSIGICLAGNFDATYPTKEQEESFKWLYRDISKRFKNLDVYPHRQFQKKTCFGMNLKDDYGQKLAQKALLEGQPEILDNTPAASEYCKAETELARKGVIQTIINMLQKLL